MSKKKIVQPIVDEVTGPRQPKEPAIAPPPKPPQPAEEDQDPGGGYNPDHTYPQT
jgi:hypothetical protein